MRSITPSSISTATGRDAARGDLGDGSAGVFVGIVDGQRGLHRLGLAHEADGDLGDQRHDAFRAGEEAGEVVARQVGLFAAGLDHRAVGQHQLQAEHVVGGDAIGQGMRSAGVFRHVAADSAGLLAGRIGGEEVAVPFHSHGDVEINHAGLHHGALVFQVDFENAVHPREGHQDAALARDGAPGEARAGPAAHERNPEFVRNPRNGGDFGGGARKCHDIGAALLHAAIVFVKGKVLRAVQIPAGTEECGKAFLQAGRRHDPSVARLVAKRAARAELYRGNTETLRKR